MWPIVSALTLLALALAACTAPTRHWSPIAPGQPQSDAISPGLLLIRYDANNDGVVTRRELEAGLRQDFWQADTKHNGCLDADEIRVYNIRRIKIDKSTAIPLIDWNDKGCLDFDEFAAPMRSLFDEFDVKRTGEITLKQMHLRIINVPVPKP